MDTNHKREKSWIYFTLVSLLCFAIGCLYLLDIRIGGPAVAFGLNVFKWLHMGLFVIAIIVGASRLGLQACAIMIVSELAGIIVWVVSILLNDPDNNLWPLGLILFSACGAVVISVGILLGSLTGQLIRKIRNTRTGNKSS
jgi:hypothetical protein